MTDHTSRDPLSLLPAVGEAERQAIQLLASLDRDRHRLVSQARDDGKSWAQIAAALGTTPGAATTRYSRGRANAQATRSRVDLSAGDS